MEVALPFFLFLHAPRSFKGHFLFLVLATLLDILKGLYQGSLRIGESHFFIILLRPYRRFPVPLEKFQVEPSLDTLSLSP